MAEIKTIEDVMKQPEADLLINHIVDRRRKGLYNLILVHGLPGTGKSSTCFRVVELVRDKYKDTEVLFRIIKSELDLVKFALDSKEDWICIGIVEETSVLFPSRRAMAGANVNAMAILDTIRKKKAIILANAPLWTSVDSHIRLMANAYVETMKIYKQVGVVISKFFRLQTNVMQGKTYFHAFQRDEKEVNRMYTKMPNLDAWKQYEIEKDEFMENLYTKIKKKAEKREEKECKDLGIAPRRTAKPLLPREAEIYSLRTVGKKKFREIAEYYEVTIPTVHEMYQNALKKLNFSKELPRFKDLIKPNSRLNKVIEQGDDNYYMKQQSYEPKIIQEVSTNGDNNANLGLQSEDKVSTSAIDIGTGVSTIPADTIIDD